MSRLRIVAGEFGGRRIEAPSGRGTRPTREKVREAWFSALGPGIAGARVLDLFAGTGALGLEALSRGAASVTFVESDRRAADLLERNVRQLGVVDRVLILRRDAAEVLDRLRGPGRDRGGEDPGTGAAEEPEGFGPFDLALADPPYGSDWPVRLARLLAERAFAGLLCVEHRPGALEAAEGRVWSRTYGDSALTFLRPPAPDGPPEEEADGGTDTDSEQGEGGA